MPTFSFYDIISSTLTTMIISTFVASVLLGLKLSETSISGHCQNVDFTARKKVEFGPLKSMKKPTMNFPSEQYNLCAEQSYNESLKRK